MAKHYHKLLTKLGNVDNQVTAQNKALTKALNKLQQCITTEDSSAQALYQAIKSEKTRLIKQRQPSTSQDDRDSSIMAGGSVSGAISLHHETVRLKHQHKKLTALTELTEAATAAYTQPTPQGIEALKRHSKQLSRKEWGGTLLDRLKTFIRKCGAACHLLSKTGLGQVGDIGETASRGMLIAQKNDQSLSQDDIQKHEDALHSHNQAPTTLKK